MHTALRATSNTLAELLRDRLRAQPSLRPFFDPAAGGTMVVSLATPEEMEDAGESGVSIWLYQIMRDDQQLNAPPRRPAFDRVEQRRLPLRVHYLMTPLVLGDDVANKPELEQEILGKVVQAFHDHPILEGSFLRDDLAGTDARLHVRWESKTVEEITRIWDALEISYQLCVSYEVSLVYIDSDRQAADGAPVIVVQPEVGVARRVEDGP